MAEAHCTYAAAVSDSNQRIVMKGNKHFISVPYAANATRILPDYLIGDREALPTYPIHRPARAARPPVGVRWSATGFGVGSDAVIKMTD